MTLEEKLELFQEQITCGKPVYMWRYDSDRHLLKSNCPYETTLASAFAIFGCKEQMFHYAALESRPLFLSAPIGLVWVACFRAEEGRLREAVVLGPVFTADSSFSGIQQILRELGQSGGVEVSMAWEHELLRILDQIPALSVTVMKQYSLMLHYTLTEEKLSFSDIAHSADDQPANAPKQTQKRDRYKVWIGEQALMQMVRDGDLNYKQAQNNASNISTGVPVHSSDPLRQAKTSTIVFASLCTRAAIEGGLSPEEAYSLGDSYIQSVESARDIAEISSLSSILYEDFIVRVHERRMKPSLSKQIRACCDYIEVNIEEPLEISELSARAGYSDYYLTRKFKSEVGVSLNDYIKIARVERAKLLLTTTDTDIQDISDRLHFCTRSYFAEAFRKIVGCPPAEYRKKYRA